MAQLIQIENKIAFNNIQSPHNKLSNSDLDEDNDKIDNNIWGKFIDSDSKFWISRQSWFDTSKF